MPNGLNHRVSAPYGDVYFVQTPKLDQTAMMLYKEQQQKDAQNVAAGKQLDDDFAKNVSGMRDADIPELVNKYNTYKTQWKQLNKKGHVITPDEQLGLLRSKADMLSHVAKSKQEKDNEELAAKDVIKNPNNFEEGAHGFLSERRKLPVTKMQVDIPNPKGKSFKMDFSDIYGNILYKGNNTDFTPITKKAEGALQPRGKTIPVTSTDGLTTTTTTFKAPNSTSEYLQTLHDGVKGSRGERDYLMQHQYDDNKAQQIIDNYSKLRQTPEFQNAYPNEPEIPATMMATPLGRSMALAAMEHTINHPPVAIVGKPVQNVGAVMDKRFNQAKALEDYKQANRVQMIGKRAEAKAAGEEAENLWIDNYIQKAVDESKNGKVNYYKSDGKTTEEYSIPLDPVLAKALIKDKVTPDELHVTPDGKFRPVYYQRDAQGKPISVPAKDGGGFKVDKIASVPISHDQLKLVLGGKAGVNQLNKEMNNQSKKTTSKPKTVIQNGHTYTLNKNGEYE